MTSLAAAAAVTDRIELLTNILVMPTRDPVLLAKEAATVAGISGGRFTLGVGVGGREDDYTVTGTAYAHRGRRADDMLDTMTRAWRGDPVPGSAERVVPDVPGGTVPLLIGGMSEAAISRMLRYGIGSTIGGAPPDQVRPWVSRVRDAWRQSDRTGEPRIVALAYYSLGDDARDASLAYLRHYYGFLGGYAERLASSALRSAEAITDAVALYEAAGVDDLILDPTVADLNQVQRLADVVL
jgi:alkanesulfonate monooxygenase SsuD/methylene tetrahydromethanopterin reductase-like flavin-dependent oxidoreductase (luciferase family)